MKCLPILLGGYLAAASVLPSSASAQSSKPTFFPAEPKPFEPVSLQVLADDCVFNAPSVEVGFDRGVLKVRHSTAACLVAGKQRVFDIGLGRLPSGTYPVELYDARQGAAPYFTGTLVVDEIVPAVLRTLPDNDYTGTWWNPAQPGSALSIHQGRGETNLLAIWNTYGQTPTGGGGRQARWQLLADGKWASSTHFTGTVYEVAQHVVTPPGVSPISMQPVGTGTLDFGLFRNGIGQGRLELQPKASAAAATSIPLQRFNQRSTTTPPAARAIVYPQSPLPFEPVAVVVPAYQGPKEGPLVSVRQEGGAIKIRHAKNECFDVTFCGSLDIGLGRLPSGDYTVEVYEAGGTTETPYFSTKVSISEAATLSELRAVPLNDYTGTWWNPAQAGNAVTIQHQRGGGDFIGIWNRFVVDSTFDPTPRPPVWNVISGGSWTNDARYEAPLWETQQPADGSRPVEMKKVGTAVFEFAPSAAGRGDAQLTINYGGVQPPVVMPLQRFQLRP